MLIPIWKPTGITSYDVIRRLKACVLRREKIGHAGTLDPFAEGILLVGIGREDTKRLWTDGYSEKEYEAVIWLGAESTTDDRDGDIVPRQVGNIPSEEAIRAVVKNFIGEIDQVPPPYSALKIGGRPAYARTRMGESVSLKSRRVLVVSLEVCSYVWPRIVIRVVTGPGVYVRALGRDIGRALGVGGYLEQLVRLRVGEYTRANAVSLDEACRVLQSEYDKNEKRN